jgi:hypothetical protein
MVESLGPSFDAIVFSGTYLPNPEDIVLAGIPLCWSATCGGFAFDLVFAASLSQGMCEIHPATSHAPEAKPVTFSCNFVNAGQDPMPPILTRNSHQASSPITAQSFQAAVSEWKRETSFVSSVSEIIGHPAFRRIVAWGPSSVPFILQELRKRPSFLIIALGEITGEDPVAASATGKVTEMSKSWLAWGEKNGLLP